MRRLTNQALAAGLVLGALSIGCQRANRASLPSGPEHLDRVEVLLSSAAPESLTGLPLAPLTCSSVEFSRAGCTGATERLEMLADPADPKNGRDDDGDGLVDEVRLVWMDPSGATQVLCSNLLALSAGETFNGIDDNGNGLIDEGGVAFHGDSGSGAVGVGLTYLGPQGTPVSTWRTIKLSGPVR